MENKIKNLYNEVDNIIWQLFDLSFSDNELSENDKNNFEDILDDMVNCGHKISNVYQQKYNKNILDK